MVFHPRERNVRGAARHLREEIKGDVVLHQDVAAVLRELCILHLKHLKTEGTALFLNGLFHRGRAEFVDLGRQERAPTRLAITRLFHQHHPRTPF